MSDHVEATRPEEDGEKLPEMSLVSRGTHENEFSDEQIQLLVEKHGFVGGIING